jgi:uncharacterized LabA/DUF88 family protein
MGRTAVFIDGGYLDKILKNLYGEARIDVGKLTDELVGSDEKLRTYYYHCPPYQSHPPTSAESERFANKTKFFAALQRLPRFEVRLGKLRKIINPETGRDEFEQKRVDVLLSVDLVLLSSKHLISRAVILGGDEDFVPAVRIAKDEGVIVTLYYAYDKAAGVSCSAELQKACDECVRIEKDLIQRVLMIKNP